MKQYNSIVRHGNQIIVRGVDTITKQRFINKQKFEPVLYKHDKTGSAKTLLNIPVSPIHFDNIKDAQNYIYDMKGLVDVYGQTNIVQQFIHENYSHVSDDFDLSLINKIVVDIETKIPDDGTFPDPNKAEQDVLLITVFDFANRDTVTFGCYPFSGSKVDVKNSYILCDDEETLLKRFLKYLSDRECDILSGWNSNGFDIPYLYNRCIRLLGEGSEKYFSPLKSSYKTKKGDIVISGIALLDALDLYKKYSMGSRESYSLAFISEYEDVSIVKQDYSDLAGGMRELYEQHWDRYVDYNIADVLACVGIIEKNSLFDIVCGIAYIAKQNYDDSLSPVRTWENLIYHHIIQDGLILDAKKDHSSVEYDGAYVKEPIPALYGWGCSIDAGSLYPSIQITLGISPEKIVGKIDGVTVNSCLNHDPVDIPDNCAMAANGLIFDKSSDGIIPTLLKKFLHLRAASKSKMIETKREMERTGKELSKLISQLHAIQLAYKTLNNSEYGALGNVHFLYYNVQAADAITSTGRFAIQHVAKTVNRGLQQDFKNDGEFVTYIDTDSVFFNVQPFVDALHETDIWKIEEKVRNFANDKIQRYADYSLSKVNEYLNSYDTKALYFKLEKVFMSALWSSKKRYAVMVLSDEGVIYHEPKVKITGLEIVRSSTPKIAKEYLHNCVTALLQHDSVKFNATVKDAKHLFDTKPIADIAFPRGVSDVNKWCFGKYGYRSGTPIAARAAILHNGLIDKHGVKNVRLIGNGAKIKYVYLSLPNPIMEDVIGFVGELPTEFSLDKYVNREIQFDKAFLSPISKLADIAGIKINLRASLDEFFN